MVARDHASDIGVDRPRRAPQRRSRRWRRRYMRRCPEACAARPRSRKTAASRHLPGAGDEVARPGIVAEPRPLAQHLFVGSGRQGLDRRPAFDEAAEARRHGRDRGLLQHHLAQPDDVGVGRRAARRASPRKRAGVGIIMSKQPLAARCSSDSCFAALAGMKSLWHGRRRWRSPRVPNPLPKPRAAAMPARPATSSARLPA